MEPAAGVKLRLVGFEAVLVHESSPIVDGPATVDHVQPLDRVDQTLFLIGEDLRVGIVSGYQRPHLILAQIIDSRG